MGPPYLIERDVEWKQIFTERHKLRNSKTELFGGQLVEPFERPSRAQYIIDRVREVDLGLVSEPDDFGLNPILAIHDKDFIEFLKVAMGRLASRWLSKAKPCQQAGPHAACHSASRPTSKDGLATTPWPVKPRYLMAHGRRPMHQRRSH